MCVAVLSILPRIGHADEITVFAAASLRDALGEVAIAYQEATQMEVVLVFAASSSIARQVAQGAPADAVLLADEAWADWLMENGAIEAAQVFASNQLVLMSAQDINVATAGDIAIALGDERLAMAQVDAVPAGRYGRAALEELGLWDALSPKVVQAANVRAALRLVERGDALMGIGYTSDLVALSGLHPLFEFGIDAPPVAQYSGAVITAQGADFMTYILGDTGQTILGDWGFLPPPVAP